MANKSAAEICTAIERAIINKSDENFPKTLEKIKDYVKCNQLEALALDMLRLATQSKQFKKKYQHTYEECQKRILQCAQLEDDVQCYQNNYISGTQAKNNDKKIEALQAELNQTQSEMNIIKEAKADSDKLASETIAYHVAEAESLRRRLAESSPDEVRGLLAQIQLNKDSEIKYRAEIAKLKLQIEELKETLNAENNKNRTLQETLAEAGLESGNNVLPHKGRRPKRVKTASSHGDESGHEDSQSEGEDGRHAPSPSIPASPLRPRQGSLNIDGRRHSGASVLSMETGGTPPRENMSTKTDTPAKVTQTYSAIIRTSPNTANQVTQNQPGSIYITGIEANICASSRRFVSELTGFFPRDSMTYQNLVNKRTRVIKPKNQADYLTFARANDNLKGTKMLGGTVGEDIHFLTESGFSNYIDKLKNKNSSLPTDTSWLMVLGVEEEIANEEINKQLIAQYHFQPRFVGRIMRSQKGRKIPTKVVKLGVAPSMANKLKSGGLNLYYKIHKIEDQRTDHIPLCHKCQKWGHFSYECRGMVRCLFCNMRHSTSSCRNKNSENKRCINCQGSHFAYDKNCPVYLNYKNRKENKQKDAAVASTSAGESRRLAPPERANPQGYWSTNIANKPPALKPSQHAGANGSLQVTLDNSLPPARRRSVSITDPKSEQVWPTPGGRRRKKSRSRSRVRSYSRDGQNAQYARGQWDVLESVRPPARGCMFSSDEITDIIVNVIKRVSHGQGSQY